MRRLTWPTGTLIPVFFTALLFSSSGPHSSLAYADVIYYKSGETLKGLVVEEHRDRIVVSTESGELSVLRNDVDEVFYDDPERNYLYLGNQALENQDFALAKGFFRKSLQMHPRFQEADDALHRLEDLEEKAASPQEYTNPLAALETQWGLTLGSTPKWCAVEKVKEDSLAKQSGLQPGDLLVSAWGESLGYLSSLEVAKALLGPEGSKVKVTIQRQIQLVPAVSRGKSWPGMTLEMEPWGLTVKSIDSKSAAQSSGIQLRDRVVAIEDRSTRYLPLPEARRHIHTGKERGIFLAIYRDLMIDRKRL